MYMYGYICSQSYKDIVFICIQIYGFMNSTLLFNFKEHILCIQPSNRSILVTRNIMCHYIFFLLFMRNIHEQLAYMNKEITKKNNNILLSIYVSMNNAPLGSHYNRNSKYRYTNDQDNMTYHLIMLAVAARTKR